MGPRGLGVSPEPWADARARLIAAALGLPISWPNEPFDQPDASAGAYVEVESTGDVLAPIEYGGGGWQEEGRLYFHVNTPAYTGSDQARAVAKDIANVYRFTGPGPTRYFGAAIGPGQPNETNGAWWTLTVIVDWKYQDTPTG